MRWYFISTKVLVSLFEGLLHGCHLNIGLLILTQALFLTSQGVPCASAASYLTTVVVLERNVRAVLLQTS